MNIPSDRVSQGRNADNSAYRDDRYVKCSRCGHPTNLDRHSRSAYGSRAGQGVSHPDPSTYDETTEQYKDGSYDGRQNDFTVTGGCPFCGSYTYDKGEA